MSQKNGNRSRADRQSKQRLHMRTLVRALRKTLVEKAPPTAKAAA